MNQIPPDAYPSSFWGVLTAVFIVQTGFGAILPLLPEFVHSRGFPIADMGIMAAAYAAISFLGQISLGSMSDRLGRKHLMLAGSLLEAAGTAGFLVHGAVAWYISCRIFQGLGSAALVPAANALVADLVPSVNRGRAYGLMSAAGSAGFALGPMLGGLAGAAWGLAAPFVIGALLNLLAAIATLITLPASIRRQNAAQADRLEFSPIGRKLWPYFMVMFAWIGMNGMYDTTWSLYMRWLGAEPWLIGISFSLFGLPLLLFNIYGGRLADHRAWRHWTILSGTGLQAITVALYIVSRSAWLSIAISVIEAGALSLTGPALSASVMDKIPESAYGRVQGWFQASGTLGATLMALASGPLLVVRPNHPFILGTTVLIAATALAAMIWRPWQTAAATSP